jgi:hypothetical protein
VAAKTKKQSRRAAQQSQPVGHDIEDWIKAKREELHQLRQPPQDDETAASAAVIRDLQLPWLRARAHELRAIEAEAVRWARVYEQAVASIEEIFGFSPDVGGARPDLDPGTVDGRSRRGSAAVLAVMTEYDQIWTAREVYEELDRRGWISPNVQHPLRGVEAAINRLWRAGKIERLGRGRYRALSPRVGRNQAGAAA